LENEKQQGCFKLLQYKSFDKFFLTLNFYSTRNSQGLNSGRILVIQMILFE